MNKVTSNSASPSDPSPHAGDIHQYKEAKEYYLLCKCDTEAWVLISLENGHRWSNPQNRIGKVFGAAGRDAFSRLVAGNELKIKIE